GADPQLMATAPAKDTTPLMAAAGMWWCEGQSRATESDVLKATKFVLELGHNVNAANARGLTALMGPAEHGFDSVVQFLVDQGADVNAKDQHGDSPVSLAYLVRPGSGKPAYPHTVALLRKLGATAAVSDLGEAKER